jgi:hypothetical protein
MNKTGKQFNQQKMVAILGAAVVLLTIVIAALLLRPATVVANFEQCKKAGGALLESYPEQCMIGGTSFTNSAQAAEADTSGYIGMTESDALAKAKQSNAPARVVERDGEGLPATMDFIFGMHNFYIKDGKVYKVDIVGQAADAQE